MAIIAENLSFELIKRRFIDYLKTKTEWQGIEFEGSNINILIDLLANTTHTNAFYQAMVANESVMDSAITRSAVLSHARQMGYNPQGITLPAAVIDIETDNTAPNSLNIGAEFYSTRNNATYVWSQLNSVNGEVMGDKKVFKSVVIKQGLFVRNVKQIQQITDNSPYYLMLENTNIDFNSISVRYITNTDDIIFKPWNTAIFNNNESLNDYYHIISNDNETALCFPPNKIKQGGQLIISYVFLPQKYINEGIQNNESVFFSNLTDTYNARITVQQKSTGGAINESINSVKENAITAYISKGRIVNENDYILFYKTQKPFSFLDVNVWGGEKNNPPEYSSVFVSFFFNEEQKLTNNEIVKAKNIVKPYAFQNTNINVVDADLFYLYFNADITAPQFNVKPQILNTINNFYTKNLAGYQKTFSLHKFIEEINNISNNVNVIKQEYKLLKSFSGIELSRNEIVIDYKFPIEEFSSNQFSINNSTPQYIQIKNNELVHNNKIIGTIDYETGYIKLIFSDLEVSEGSYPSIEFYAKPKNDIFTMLRENILYIDQQYINLNIV